MYQPSWGEGRPPAIERPLAVWDRPLASPGEITWLRRRLREQIRAYGGPGPTHDDDVDRLLLAFEELAANALRHGQAPVAVTLTTTAEGWLIDVTDTATGHVPTPAPATDPSKGGLGLPMVATICIAHGWYTDGSRKHVWAFIARRSARS